MQRPTFSEICETLDWIAGNANKSSSIMIQPPSEGGTGSYNNNSTNYFSSYNSAASNFVSSLMATQSFMNNVPSSMSQAPNNNNNYAQLDNEF